MRDVQKLRELLERCEKATGPDANLDTGLHSLMHPDDGARPLASAPGWLEVEGIGTFKAGRYSASLDLSIYLVESMLPGWQMLWRTDAEKGAFANIAKPGEHEWLPGVDAYNAYASKPPLAVISALLRALISQAEGEGNNA